MTKKKKLLIIFGAIFGTVYIVAMMFFVVSIPWTLMYLGGMSEELPEPKVSYAEFPFELVYEINGERKEIKDTLIIEFEGFGWNEGVGKYYDWNGYFKSEATDEFYYKTIYNEELMIFNGYANIYKSDVEVWFMLGTHEYYMGVEEDGFSFPFYAKNLKAGDFWIDSSSYTGLISEDELYEKLGIKIIKKSLSPPIS